MTAFVQEYGSGEFPDLYFTYEEFIDYLSRAFGGDMAKAEEHFLAKSNTAETRQNNVLDFVTPYCGEGYSVSYDGEEYTIDGPDDE